RTDIIKIPNLEESILNAMSDIYLAHYDSSDAALFRNDLAGKSEALLVYKNQVLVGFTLYELYQRNWQGRPINIIYSGDTVVDRAHWGQQALAFSWIARAGQIKRQEPDTPLYWFLIVKGHRTYRYLPTFSRSFHPHWSKQHADLKQLADWLAAKKFGNAYDPFSGVIRFTQSRGHLKTAYAHPTDRELNKDSVRFFLQRNPGYLAGHELVCLCELSKANLKPLARRLFSGNAG
ncbi:MAG: hypothetical protein ABFS39_15815, partial [Pseudomonadota bacterium]